MSSSTSMCPRTLTCAATSRLTWGRSGPSVRNLGGRLPARLQGGAQPRPTTATPSAFLLPAAPASHSQTLRTVDVVLHEDVDPYSDAVKSAVAAAARVDKDTMPTGRRKFRLTVEERFLDDLASIDAVRVIQEVPKVKLRNNVARPILNAEVLVSGTTYEGAGEVIAVADTGFDTGSTAISTPRSPADCASVRPRSRGKTDDPHGHGTHVCGSAAGDGTSASMGGAIRGTAPRATLVVQSLIDSYGRPRGHPGRPHRPVRTPLSRRRRPGSHELVGRDDPGLPYDQSAREIDDFVWNHPDMVICFAAGNDGTDSNGDGVVDPASIGSEFGRQELYHGRRQRERPERRRTDRTEHPAVRLPEGPDP